MIISGNEMMEPEELAQLGGVFDEAWAAVSASVSKGRDEQTDNASRHFVAAGESQPARS